MSIRKFCGLYLVAAFLFLGTGNSFSQKNQNIERPLNIASDYPGPIAPIGPHGPPQPIDDEAIT